MIHHPRTRASQTASEPATFKKKVKAFPMSQDSTQKQSIILLSKKLMVKYRVYLDEEIGFPASYRDTVHEMDADEDNDSSDDIIEYGVEKCLKLLQKRVGQMKKESQRSTQTDETESDFKSVVTVEKLSNLSVYRLEDDNQDFK